MHITELVWDDETVSHIQKKHRVDPKEVEDACFSEDAPLVLTARGGAPIYYVLGQTSSGRYLFIVIRYLFRGKAKPITARNMEPGEKRRYHKMR